MIRLSAFFILFAATAFAADPNLHDQVTALFRDRKWAEAQTLIEKSIATEPANAEAHFLLGVSFLNRNDAEHAVSAFEQAVALDPASSSYVRHLGDAYGLTAQKAGLFSKMGWAKKCKAAYDKAVELDPKDINARWSVMEFCRQAPSFIGGGMDLAYTQAEAIKQLDPARGRLAYVTLYLAEKKYPEAFMVYDEVLKTTPDDFGALFQIGRISAISGERLDQGLAALQRCLAVTPTPAGQPGPAPLNFLLGSIWEKKGDKIAARAAYEAALASDPKLTRAADALAKLK